MTATQLRGTQVLDGSVQRQDVDVSTAGSALIRKVIAGSGITLASTGPDTGTGDVTVTNSVVNAYYSPDTQTASYTLASADFTNGYFRANFTAAGTVTIPPNSSVACPVGFSMPIAWVGGQFGFVTISPGSGVTLRNTNGASFVNVTIARPGGIVSITQIAANVWEFVGPTDCQPNGSIYRLGSTVAISNTATETSVLPAPAAGVAYGFKTIKANVAVPGLYIMQLVDATYTTPATPSTLTLKVKLGSVTLKTIALTGIIANAAALKLAIEANVVYQSIGSTGTVVVSGIAYFNITSNAVIQLGLDTAAITVDTTADSLLDMTLTWSAAQTGQSVSVTSAMIQANQ